MKYFNKSSKLDYVSYDVRGPVLEEADRMVKRGIDIIKLNTGNPAAFDFKAPNEIIHDLITNARESEGYSDSKGIFQLEKRFNNIANLKDFQM